MGTNGYKLKSDVYTKIRRICKIKGELAIWLQAQQQQPHIPSGRAKPGSLSTVLT